MTIKTDRSGKLLAAAFIILAVCLGIVMLQGQPARANAYTGTVLSSATTTASFAVTTSARVLATTTNALGGYTRVYASICNANSNPVYLNLDGDKAAGVGAVTTIIAAAAGYSACYEITDRNLYQGSITASSSNQTSTSINVKDYVQ